MRRLRANDKVMSLEQCRCQDLHRGDRWGFVAYSAVSLNKKPVDGQSVRENLTGKVSKIWVRLVAERLPREPAKASRTGERARLGSFLEKP